MRLVTHWWYAHALCRTGPGRCREDGADAHLARKGIERQLDQLLSLRLHELITEEEFKAKKADLSAQRDEQQARLDARDVVSEPHPATEGFRLGATLRRMFLGGGPEVQRQLLFTLDTRLVLRENKVDGRLPIPLG